MRFYNFLYVAVLLFFALSLQAQSKDPRTGYFLVEEEKFSPPDSAIISHFVGRQAMAFMANDMDQNEQYLGNYKGNNVLLWFWQLNCDACLSQIDVLNKIADEWKGKLSIISLCNNNRAEIDAFLAKREIGFSIIPNAGILAEGAFADDLGYPRLFFLDREGIITHILPMTFFEGIVDLENAIRSFLGLDK